MNIVEGCRMYSYNKMVQQECAHHILSVSSQMAMHETAGLFLLAQLNNFRKAAICGTTAPSKHIEGTPTQAASYCQTLSSICSLKGPKNLRLLFFQSEHVC